MTFASSKGQLGRKPLDIIRLTLDKCDNTYSEAPCTAGDLENHILKTEIFSASLPGWSKIGVVVVENDDTDPLGGSTADKITESATTGFHTVNQSGSVIKANDTYIASVYVKTDERSRMYMEMTRKNDTQAGTSFNLNDDTVFDSSSTLSTFITDAGGGWKRVGFNFNALTGTDAGNLIIGLVDDNGDREYTGTVSEGLHVWGAQVTNVKTNPNNVYFSVNETTQNATGFECYNTFGTCQDTPNYVRTTTNVDVCSQRDIPAELDAFPCIKSISYAPAVVEHGGIGKRASVTVTMEDFTFNDTGLDPYLSTRATPSGTFFGRFLARNKFYQGRSLQLLEGFINNPFSLNDFRTRRYIIDSFRRVSDTQVSIVAKDVLKLADNGKVQVPSVSTGTLLEDVTTTDTEISVSAALASQYQGFTQLSINDEVMNFTWSSDGVFAVTRTEAVAHSAGDVVQALKTWLDEHPVDVIEEILTDFAGIAQSFIDDWSTEKTTTLAGANVTATVPPTGATRLIEELTEQFNISLWWDDLSQLIRLQAFSASRPATFTLNDEDNHLEGKISVLEELDKRISQYWVYYGIINPIDDFDKPQNYRKAFIKIDSDAESTDEYGTSEVKKVFSRWIEPSDFTQPNLLASTNLNRFRDGQSKFKFQLDIADEIKIGDVGDITTRHKQDETGADKTTRVQIVKAKPVVGSHSYEYEAVSLPDPTSATPEIVINQDRVNFNVYTELGNPTQSVQVVVSVLSGVTVRSDNNSIPAFDTGNLPSGSNVTVILDGDVVGMGGNGGRGGDTTNTWIGDSWVANVGSGQNGVAGGDAFNFTVDGSIDFTGGGNAWAGGGGGAGDDGQASGTIISDGVAEGGPGGGGAQGSFASTGGAGGLGILVGGTGTETQGAAGASGGPSGAGAGGSGGAGAGGSYGASGTSSGTATGGAGGFAVRENGNTVTLTGSNGSNTLGSVG